jgi:hypothetical protein
MPVQSAVPKGVEKPSRNPTKTNGRIYQFRPFQKVWVVEQQINRLGSAGPVVTAVWQPSARISKACLQLGSMSEAVNMCESSSIHEDMPGVRTCLIKETRMEFHRITTLLEP